MSKYNVISVRCDELKNHPDNARIGDVNVIAKSIKSLGQYKPLVVQKSTNYVLAGNHTLKALIKLNKTNADVIYVDCDDDRAKKILIADNSTSDKATYDKTKLLETLEGLEEDFVNSLYNQSDVEKLRNQVYEVNDFDIHVNIDDIDVEEKEASFNIKNLRKYLKELAVNKDLYETYFKKLEYDKTTGNITIIGNYTKL